MKFRLRYALCGGKATLANQLQKCSNWEAIGQLPIGQKLREVAVQSCLLISQPIGGVGTVMEIDESKLGESKF